MDNTLDIFAHIYKSFLNKQNQKMNKHVQKLIAAFHISQWVNGIPLLILKKSRPAERATIERWRWRGTLQRTPTKSDFKASSLSVA
jgi:hypothetical protein